MDTTLATVTIISLLLAWAMAIVTWQRIRAERRCSDARLADMMAELADEPGHGVGSTEPPEISWAPAARSPVAPFARRGASRGFARSFREPATPADAPPSRRPRAPLAPRRPVGAQDAKPGGGDGAAHGQRIGTERALPRAGAAEVPRGLPTRAWSYLRRVVYVPMPPATSHWGHRAAAVAVATVLVAGVSLADLAPSRPRAGADLPVELLSLDHRRQGSYLAVSGSLRNPPAGRERSKLSITATVFDRTGAIIGTGQTPLPAAVLPPGGETAFRISLPSAARINRYRVSFMEDRSQLPHVDRRGPEAGAPAGTGARP